MNVNLSDIIEAIEFTDDMTHSFLDKVTGEIVTVNEFGMTSKEQEAVYDTLDEHGFYRLPDQYELNGYRTMAEFIETLSSPARDRLEIAISGRGAFRRFKDEIRRLGVEKAWYQYEADENRRKAKNRNQLMKAVTIAEEMGLKEGTDFFLIKDNCLTELEPEEIGEDGIGRTLTCIGFRPLSEDIAHQISRKYQLYR